MKRQLFYVPILFFLLFTSSCVTKRQHGSWQEYPPVPFFCTYKVMDTSVTIDHVREEAVAEQLSMISQTYLESKQQYNRDADKILLLTISVEQRSFMQNVELYNSIYVSCIARDEEGRIYAKENEYISGKQTFIAAAEQSTIITRILNRFLSDQRKRYKEIEKYEKDMAKGK